jgi:hypothetical protein
LSNRLPAEASKGVELVLNGLVELVTPPLGMLGGTLIVFVAEM